MNLNTISDRELVAAVAGRLAFVRSDLEVAEADATKAERERDEARAEVERLRLAASDIATDLAYEEVVTIPEADEEIERLTAEVERLREAGADLLAHPRSSRARLRMHEACGTSPLDGLAEVIRDRNAAKRHAASTHSGSTPEAQEGRNV